MMRPSLVAAVVLAVLLTASACGTEPTVGGRMLVSLETPASDDGALAVVVTGPGIAEVMPTSSSYSVYWRLASATEARVLVFGNISPGPLFALLVEDRSAVFVGQVTEVARRDDALRDDPVDYTISIVPLADPE
ncbi:MAG TPA: hypothetical protein VGA37_12070 [Gemmatimonadales bacterium]